jgi:hypothetical protein
MRSVTDPECIGLDQFELFRRGRDEEASQVSRSGVAASFGTYIVPHSLTLALAHARPCCVHEGVQSETNFACIWGIERHVGEPSDSHSLVRAD